MPLNDPIILQQILEQRKKELAPEMSDADFFELFVAEEILKDRALSYDELTSGHIGGSNDGGVDGIWLFANGELIREDSDLDSLKRNVVLELFILQAKRATGFGEEPINKLIAVTENLFDLSNRPADFSDRYSSELVAAAELFRGTYQTLAGRFPTLKIKYYYATLGSDVHPNTQTKSNDLKAKVPALFSDAETTFDFIGASNLLALVRQQPKTSFTLNLAESPISASGAVAYICLVKLNEWFSFVTDDNENIVSEIFEVNVRDYQGNTEVNREIQSSLQASGPEDFWWLNNGITVLASQAIQSGKALTLEDPQIVNGLQTSRQIYDFYKQAAVDEDDNRLVLVRVIVPEAEESRDRIIKATNSQTYIPPASLKATDKIQRDIEEYLHHHGIYYDRRKNFYKNQGKPIADIIGIAKMAQSMMAISLARPDDARARPSSLIKSDADYERLFNESHPIAVYHTCIAIVRSVENRLREIQDLEQKDRNNLRFYVALEVARKLTGEKIPSMSNLRQLDHAQITESILDDAIQLCRGIYEELGSSDQVAKGTELKNRLNANFDNAG